MVFGFLRPADQDGAPPVHPGVGGLNDPAAGPPPGVTALGVGFLAAASDVGCEPTVGESLPDAAGVIPLIQAHPVRGVVWRSRPTDRATVQRLFQQSGVVTVRAVGGYRDRDAPRVDEDRPFRPLLPRSVGFAPVFSPPNGAFVVAPSAASHCQSIPTISSYSTSPCRQISRNTPAFSHSWKRRWAVELEHRPVAFNAFHCIPARATNKIASITRRLGTPRLCVPNGCTGGGGKSGSMVQTASALKIRC